MMITRQTQNKKKDTLIPGNKNYNDIVEYLDSLVPYEYSEHSINRMKTLDQHLGNLSKKIDIIVVGGTNGKSSTIHFAKKLLKEEGFKSGSCFSSHFLTYNERITSDFESISNKDFADVVSDIITAAQGAKVDVTTHEIMLFASLQFFITNKVDVALLEVGMGGKFDASAYFNPKVTAVTRVTPDNKGILSEDMDELAQEMLEIAKKDSWFISAEQSKIRLQKMKTWCEDKGAHWSMPIRKLATLPYLYEQLFGRTASLGERVAQIYVEDVKGKFSPFLRGNLLATEKGQRGRPTLEAKRNAELNPIKSLKGFWGDNFDLLRGRFEHLDKEKPSILLDNASNLDALANLFLGVRLLHYQRPLKGFVLILGIAKTVKALEAIKLLRYLLKKVSGHVIFVPLSDDVASHDPIELATFAKEFNIKAKTAQSFDEAMIQAKSCVDERDGLVVISGSKGLVCEYWNHRGIKKF